MIERTVQMVQCPRDRLWETLRDRAPHLARFLDGVVSTQSTVVEPTVNGVMRREHRWRATARVPPIIAPHVDTSYLEWTCRTEWYAEDFRSRWLIEPAFLKDRPLCLLSMAFAPALGGRGTRLQVEIDLSALRPEALRVVTARIVTTHLRDLVEAARRLAEEGDRALPGENAHQVPGERD
jgi:hypothetical protein